MKIKKKLKRKLINIIDKIEFNEYNKNKNNKRRVLNINF